MGYSTIIEEFKKLSSTEQSSVLKTLRDMHDVEKADLIYTRGYLFDNKQIGCPYCKSLQYVKYGTDKGSKRYKCKLCKRTFTEFTGTWLSKIQKKELIIPYLKEMQSEKSLDKIRKSLKISKQTAFNWRHKILSSIEDDKNEDDFTGITESDETFFLKSEKGSKITNREPRKRGSRSNSKGISNDHIAVIVTRDRKNQMDITVSNLGRISKKDIENAIGSRVSEKTIMCTDGHVSYKGFAIDNKLEHHVVRANLKEFVKQKKYHIQHINSAHSHIKKWIENRFYGVSAKYLQKYMNWFKLKEKLKSSKNIIEDFVIQTLHDDRAYRRFHNISEDYYKMLQK